MLYVIPAFYGDKTPHYNIKCGRSAFKFYHAVIKLVVMFNALMGTDNYIATSNNMKLVHWPLMGGMLHLVQR